MAEIFKLSNRKIKEVQDELKDLKEALYGYVLDTAQIETTGAIPQTVTIGSGTYNLVDDVRGFVSEVKGNTVKFGNFLKSVNYEGLKVSGANLLNIADKASTTTNGVTYSISNGVITLNGTATASSNFSVTLTNVSIPSGTYYFESGSEEETKSYIYCQVENLWKQNVSFTLSETKKCPIVLRITINAGAYSNFKLKPMLVRGSTAPTTFKPYKEPVTILPFNTTLRGVNTVRDKIVITKNTSDDYYTATKVSNVGEVDLGTLSWTNDQQYGGYWFANFNGVKTLGAMISTLGLQTYTDFAQWASASSGQVLVNDSIRFKGISQAPTGMLCYELATPTTTVLSATLTEADVMPLLELGGSIEVLNNNSAYAQGSTVIEMVYKLINTAAAASVSDTPAVQSEEEPANE